MMTTSIAAKSRAWRGGAYLRKIRSMPAHDRAIGLLLADLTQADFRHPESGHRLIYQLV